MTNKLLLRRMNEDNDERALEDLFNAHSKWLYATAFSIVKDQGLAEEIVEDVFFKLWQNRDKYSSLENLESFLFVCTKNLSYDHIRKRGNRHFISLDEQMLNQHEMGPDQIYELNELKEMIELSVKKLPPRCKSIFELVRNKGYSYKEAAKILNLTPKTVENQLRIAAKKMYIDLEQYFQKMKIKVS
jgi:RNA polymerase sigma-70 factor (family 1)